MARVQHRSSWSGSWDSLPPGSPIHGMALLRTSNLWRLEMESYLYKRPSRWLPCQRSRRLADDLARVVMIGGMTYPNHPRPYDPYPGQEPPRAAIVCPKCHGAMRTYERNGIQLEQCGSCRGLFLDFGELEHLTQMEGRFVNQAPPPPGYGPAWGKHGDRRYRKGGLAGLFFSS